MALWGSLRGELVLVKSIFFLTYQLESKNKREIFEFLVIFP